MQAAPPMQRPPVDRTFPVAMSLLALVALAQFGSALYHAFHPAVSAPVAVRSAAPAVPSPPQKTPAVPTPAPAPVLVLTAEQDLIRAAEEKRLLATLAKSGAAAEKPPALLSPLEAEKRLLQSLVRNDAGAERRPPASLPKPTPLPVRREATPQSRVNELMNMAHALRERGDTSTALTRLREAQVISSGNPRIISEMAITYEKMGLNEKALEQWRRIYEFGEQAGIYYAAADAKLRAASAPAAALDQGEGLLGPMQPAAATGPVLSLGTVGTTDDTGNSQPLRRLKLRIPILARPGSRIDVRDVVIQVYFYDQLKDGSVVETDANVSSEWARDPNAPQAAVDWSTPGPEVLEVEYAQPEPNAKDPRSREHRNYFGYGVRVYYKGELNATHAEPVKLLKQFPPPVTLPTSDLPQ